MVRRFRDLTALYIFTGLVDGMGDFSTTEVIANAISRSSSFAIGVQFWHEQDIFCLPPSHPDPGAIYAMLSHPGGDVAARLHPFPQIETRRHRFCRHDVIKSVH